MNTFLKGPVPVESNEARLMVGGTTWRKRYLARQENGAEMAMDVGVQEAMKNGALSPSEGVLTRGWPEGPRHGDTSTVKAGSVWRWIGVSMPVGLRSACRRDRRPRFITSSLAAGRCGRGVHDNGTWGRSWSSWATQLCQQADFGVRWTALVNTSH